MTLGKIETKRFAASAVGRRYIACAAQSSSGAFIGVGRSPRLPRLAVPARTRFFSACIAAIIPGSRSSWTLSIAPISSEARAPLDENGFSSSRPFQ